MMELVNCAVLFVIRLKRKIFGRDLKSAIEDALSREGIALWETGEFIHC